MKLEAGEQVLLQDKSARYIKGKLSIYPGTLVLTNQRLAFEQRSSIALAFGLLGMLILAPLLPGKVVVNLPPAKLAGFSRGKYGRNENVVAIATREGEEYRFLAQFDRWASVLAQAGVAQG